VWSGSRPRLLEDGRQSYARLREERADGQPEQARVERGNRGY